MSLQQVPREVVESPPAESFKIWWDRDTDNQVSISHSPASGRRLNHTAPLQSSISVILLKPI